MTEFISRKYDMEGYEIIIKTDSHEHYRSAEEFAMRLIDHSKPMTNADRIRSMTDDELANVLNAFTAYFVECNRSADEVDCGDCELNDLCSLHEGKAIDWLQQPAEKPKEFEKPSNNDAHISINGIDVTEFVIGNEYELSKVKGALQK